MAYIVTSVIERVKEGVVKPSDTLTKLTCYIHLRDITPLPAIPTGDAKVKFCAFLQVPISLYGDRRNINSFTASQHLQEAIKYSVQSQKSS
jgi:hypothetical protein